MATKAKPIEYWICTTCGKKHSKAEDIRHVGKGHQMFFAKEYWSYVPDQKRAPQTTLF